MHPLYEDAARQHAAANRTDPFAYARIMLHMENRIEHPQTVIVDAKRMTQHAPQNPAMIAAAIKAGLL